MTATRTHHCGELRAAHVGLDIFLQGWVHNVRTFGGLVFLLLRDRFGITQVAFNEANAPELTAQAKALGREDVVGVRGKVLSRGKDANPNMATGEIEVEATGLELYNKSRTPPFEIRDDLDVSEETRLKWRFLDLRRPALQKILVTRHKINQLVRSYLDSQGFLELETPVLTRSTPEGARDFLVPSRIHPGHFYALPQSPQLFKQLLMVAGYDRYFQIVKCFRDEDLRNDR